MILGVAVGPVVGAGLATSSADYATLPALLNVLGRLTGILALSLFLVAGCLSIRIPGFDRYFGGLTKLWKFHHRIATAAFLCMLLHPLLLVISSHLISLSLARAVLFPGFVEGAAVWLGWGALLAAMVFLAPSFGFFGRPYYQRWKLLHRLSAVTLILAVLHTLSLSRTLPGNSHLLVWGVLVLGAGAAMSYRFFVAPRLFGYRYAVAEVAHLDGKTVEITMRPLGKTLSYKAGQFVYLAPLDRTLGAGYAEEHPYTISSSPQNSDLRVAIKGLGDASRALLHITPGSVVRLDGPYGDFFLPVESEFKELWIAGGIGVTPFLSRARTLALRAERYDVCFIYCVQDASKAVFMEEFRRIAVEQPGLKLFPHYFSVEGALSAEFLTNVCPDVAERLCYLCGPLPLMQIAKDLLQKRGVAESRIRSEDFELL